MLPICTNCGTTLSEDLNACEKCGSRSRTLRVTAVDETRVLDELDVMQTTDSGKVLGEFSGRNDGKKIGTIAVDWAEHDRPIRAQGRLSERLCNFQDEVEYAAAFALALNQRTGRMYAVEPKAKEDSDVPDRWIRDDHLQPTNADHRLAVQITHLDSFAIASLGRHGGYDVQFDVVSFVDAAIEAINRKSEIDRTIASKSYLVLITPYPIRASLQPAITDAIQQRHLQAIYRETWIVPFHELPFRIL